MNSRAKTSEFPVLLFIFYIRFLFYTEKLRDFYVKISCRQFFAEN